MKWKKKYTFTTTVFFFFLHIFRQYRIAIDVLQVNTAAVLYSED